MLLKMVCPMLVVGLALSAQVEVGQRQPGRGLNLYSFEKEQALGAQLAEDVRARTTPVDDAEIAGYIERLAGQLAVKVPGRAWIWRFAVIREDRGGTREPFVCPGGYIFVSIPLITAVHDEAELAGMLAHAMAHVAERQGTRQATRGEVANMSSIPLIFMGAWSGPGIEEGKTSLVPVGFLAFQRRFELEADGLAAKVMADAGFDPSALVRYVERTQIDPADQSKQFSTMPRREQRVAALEQVIAGLPAVAPSSTGDFESIQNRARQIAPLQKPARPSLLNPRP